MPLINQTPYVLTVADGPMTPVVISVPHSGLAVDAEDEPLLACDRQTLLRDADLFVDRLVASAPDLGATSLVATVSRYVLDVNRGLHEVDLSACPNWDRVGEAARPRGLIWRQSTEGHRVLERPLTRSELQSRVDRIHRPYHEALRRLLDERRNQFGYAVLLDAHSMPSVGRTGHRDDGLKRADVVPGDNHGESCDPRLTQLVVDHFQDVGLRVKLNEPYSGGYITRFYGQPKAGFHAIQIELNRSLYMDEPSVTWDETKGEALGAVIHALVRKLLGLQLI